jgi:hypothetical protein
MWVASKLGYFFVDILGLFIKPLNQFLGGIFLFFALAAPICLIHSPITYSIVLALASFLVSCLLHATLFAGLAPSPMLLYAA